jgi:hypothetical protein
MKLKLPEGPFKAYLFDCDGTIADSMPLHYVAWKKALDECGCDFPEYVFYSWGGMPAAEVIATLSARQGLVLDAEAIAHRKELLYYEMLPQLQAVPEVLEEIAHNYALGAARIPMAVVSGSTRDSRPLRNPGVRRRLHPVEAGSRAVPDRRRATWCSPGRLPGLRRYRTGHSVSDRSRHGERKDSAAVGTGERFGSQ